MSDTPRAEKYVLFYEALASPQWPIVYPPVQVQQDLKFHPGWYFEHELIGEVVRYRWWVPKGA